MLGTIEINNNNNNLSVWLNSLGSVLRNCLLITLLFVNIQVRFTAARAAVAFILANEGETAILSHFKDLLPLILQVCVILWQDLSVSGQWNLTIFG